MVQRDHHHHPGGRFEDQAGRCATFNLPKIAKIENVEDQLAKVAEQEEENDQDQSPGQLGLSLLRTGIVLENVDIVKNFFIQLCSEFVYLIGAEIFRFSHLQNDLSVENGQDYKRNECSDHGTEPVYVVKLVVIIQPHISGNHDGTVVSRKVIYKYSIKAPTQ